LIVTQTTDEDGNDLINVVQPGAASIKGTEEKRVIPKDPTEKLWNDHQDHIFGAVKGNSTFRLHFWRSVTNMCVCFTGYTQWRQLSELKDDNEDDAFLKQNWPADETTLLDGFVESQGNGWTARQVWGFALVGGVRKHVRRVVVRKGSSRATANFVYDFKEERR
jgi:hypothetical protein